MSPPAMPKSTRMSKAGLFGLGLELQARTAYEPAPPVGVDIETRRPLVLSAALLADVGGGEGPVAQGRREDRPLHARGRDDPVRHPRLADLGPCDAEPRPARATLRRLLAKLDIPPLEPIPEDHVITRTFYLLEGIPRTLERRTGVGRGASAARSRTARPKGPSQRAAATACRRSSWAAMTGPRPGRATRRGQPIAAVVPGGEQQRETAIRFGINVVIYAMTGNYKTDQVHVPALLERLGK